MAYAGSGPPKSPDGTEGYASITLTLEKPDSEIKTIACIIKNDVELQAFQTETESKLYVKTHEKTKFFLYFFCSDSDLSTRLVRSEIVAHRFTKPTRDKKCTIENKLETKPFVFRDHVFLPASHEVLKTPKFETFLNTHSKAVYFPQKLSVGTYRGVQNMYSNAPVKHHSFSLTSSNNKLHITKPDVFKNLINGPLLLFEEASERWRLIGWYRKVPEKEKINVYKITAQDTTDIWETSWVASLRSQPDDSLKPDQPLPDPPISTNQAADHGNQSSTDSQSNPPGSDTSFNNVQDSSPPTQPTEPPSGSNVGLSSHGVNGQASLSSQPDDSLQPDQPLTDPPISTSQTADEGNQSSTNSQSNPPGSDTSFNNVQDSSQPTQPTERTHGVNRQGNVSIKCTVGVSTFNGLVYSWVAGSAFIIQHYLDDPDRLIQMIQQAIIPTFVTGVAGATVYALVAGCFKILVEVRSLDALDEIWKSYIEGDMKKKLEKVLVTDDMRKLAPHDAEKVEISLMISEDEYKEARDYLVESVEVPFSRNQLAKPFKTISKGTTMESWKAQLFMISRFCLACAVYDCLTLNDEEIICLYEECAAVAVYLNDIVTQRLVYMLLWPLYEKIHQMPKAIEYYKKKLQIALEVEDRKMEVSAYENLGIAYRSMGKYEEAIEYHEKSLNIAKLIKPRRIEAVSYCNLGNDYHYSGNFQKSVEYLEKCLDIAIQIGDKQLEGDTYGNLGNAYLMLGKPTKALEYSEKHLSTVIALGDRIGEGDACKELGRVYNVLGEYHKAIEYLQKCLDIATEMGDKRMKGKACGNLGQAFLSLARYQEAIEYEEKLLDIAIEIGDKVEEGASYLSLGIIYQSLGKSQQAIDYYNKSLSLAVKVGDRALEGLSYGNLGTDFLLLGNYQKAMEYQKQFLSIAVKMGDRKLTGMAYGGLGNVYHSLGQFQVAIECHTQLLNIAVEIGDRRRERVAFANLGYVYYSQGKYPKALEYFGKVLHIAVDIGDKKNEGETLGNLGNVYQSLGNYSKAIEFKEKQLAIAIKIGDRNGEAAAYGNLGNGYQLFGNYNKAIQFHEKSLSISKEIGNIDGEGITHNNLGIAYESLGQYHTAIELFEKCLCLALQIGSIQGEEASYGNLGSVYHRLGKYHEAKKYFDKRLEIDVKIGYMKGEGASYRSLGNVYLSLGKYQKAIDYQQQSLDIALEIGDKVGEGTAYTNLGNAYRTLGKYIQAKEYYEKHLNIALEIGDRKSEGTAYGSIGNVHFLLSEYQSAIAHHEKCLTIAVHTGDRKSEGDAYGNLGICYHAIGESTKAIVYQEKGLKIAMEIGDRKAESLAFGNIGGAYQSQGRYQEAIVYHQKYLNAATEIEDREGQGQAHFLIGSCYESLATNGSSDYSSRMKETENSFKKSMECFESLFDDLEENDQHKIAIVDTFIQIYRKLSLVYVQTGRSVQALLVSERSRARALADLLNFKYSMVKYTPASKISLEVADIETILSASNFVVLFYALQQVNLAVHIWALAPQSPFHYHESEIKGLETPTRHPSFYENNSDSSHEESFSTLVEKSYQMLKVREGLTCEDRSLEIPEDGEETLQESKQSEKVRHPGARCAYDEEDDERPLELLFEALIAPLQHQLDTCDEIVIIPDGDLFMVPFPALQDPETGQYLSETKRLRLAPSLTTLKVLQESSGDHHYKSGALIVGNPKVGKVKFKGREKWFTDLPGAANEAEEIAKLLGVQPLIGEKATKETILQKLQVGVSVIHFAAHGGANGQIILAPSASSNKSIPDEDDYILTVEEAQQSGIRAQLVILSCCKSGRGEIKSEGVVGMSRAFLAAGARAVVASLWAIDDEATKVFMLKLYGHLMKKECVSLSLQQTMKEMRETDNYKEPRSWAAFFLIGDDVTINL